ncbi:response regulator [Microbulbifer bruguierae]|uniref:histidine kinase n=1 Tax=Microbulbifer bruguierae TaxID=3029061 RepID=A0ABY8NE98_9GAMM|nr:response regulator [Microbulbifer bruguierae]WGL16719.1 response regulator [Microbulbifer bruguierae]
MTHSDKQPQQESPTDVPQMEAPESPPVKPPERRKSSYRSRRRVSLRTILFRYTLAPALILAVLLCLIFTLQQMSDRRDLLLSHGHASAQQLVELIELSDNHPFEVRIEWLNKSLMALMLERDMIRSVQLYRAVRNNTGAEELTLISSVGPRPRANLKASDLQGRGGHVYEDLHSLQVIQPLLDAEAHCWLAIELHRPYFLVGTYQVALVGLLGLIVCALTALVWAVILAERATRSLDRFKETLRAIGQGKLTARAASSRNLELSQLAEEINLMAANLTDYQRDYQESLHQTMEDLRQSMDAMEEQNIELELSRKKAVEYSRLRSTFLTNTTHEIRTPLNGIIGFTNLLLKTEVDQLQRDYLQTILRSSESLLTSINDILDFSRIESGNLVLDHSPMNIGQVVEETLQILAPYGYEHGLELVPFIDPLLPPSQIGDPLRIKQILTNLVSTAIRSSENGNIPVTVTVQSGKESELMVRVNIIDNGARCDEQTHRELKHIINSSLPHQELSNNGLGLSIARSLIETMQGEMGLDDNEQGGCTFWINLPLAIDRNRVPTTREQFPGCHLLLADPNPMTRRQIEQQLRHWQAEPLEHGDGQSLVPTVEQMWRHDAMPDALIIDTANAAGDFESFIGTVQQLVDTFQCRVVVQGSPADLRRCYDALRSRVLAFLGKPVSREGLLRALKRALPHHAQSRPVTGSFPPLPWPNKPRILVVDDYEANRLLMSELLRGQHIEVQVAASGREALAMWREQQFDMIFMDIQMPEMDGIATTGKIRQEESGHRTPIIALTAHAGTEEKSRLLSAGLDDYLSKPVSETQLSQTVKRWLQVYASTHFEPPAALVESRLVDITESLDLANQDPSLARDLLRMLLKSLHDEEREISRYYGAGDHKALFECVHRLHGGCCYCGVPRLRAATEQLQEYLRPLQEQEQADIDASAYELLTKEIRSLRDWAAEQDLDALFGLEQIGKIGISGMEIAEEASTSDGSPH